MQNLLILSVIALLIWLGSILIKAVLETKNARRTHQLFKQTIKQLRLSKMIAFLGANLDDYVRFVPAKDILAHVGRCTKCSTADICDSCLRDGKVVQNMNFCPNYRSLTVHSKTLASQVSKHRSVLWRRTR
jgi:hypothetical protein